MRRECGSQSIVLLSLGFSMLAATLFALGTNPEVTGAQVVLLQGPDSAARLNEILVGEGIAGITAQPLLGPAGGSVEWALIRDETDEISVRHLFFRQVYRPTRRFVSGLDARYLAEGIPLLGSEIGIHSKDGKVTLVFGTQFRGLSSVNAPTIVTAADAMAAGHAVLATLDGYGRALWFDWSHDFAEAQLARVQLLLLSEGDGTSFRFVWEVPAVDDEGIASAVYLDAATAFPIVVERRRLADDDRCTPDPGYNPVPATGKAQWGSLPDRSISATRDPHREPNFTHETHWPANPTIQLFQYFSYNDPGYGTYNCAGRSTGLVPLKTVSGSVVLDDWQGYPIKGKMASDAMLYTKQTMDVFYTNLYRYSYDGNGGDARVVTDVKIPGSCDNSEFRIDQCDESGLLCNAVLVYQICPNAPHLPVAVTACLDTVAHEWGHGVVKTSANFPYGESRDPVYGTVGAQLHEGFSDVIGYAVEWYKQPKAANPDDPPLEQADWLFQEDCGWNRIPGHPKWKRRVDQPNSSGAFHRLDQVGNTEAHFRGNALVVAYRMMYEGKKNPDGARFGTDGIVPAKLDRDRSTRILFRILTRLATSTTPWWALPDLGKQAAYDLYSFCSLGYSATTEQDSVVKAFLGVGYQGITGGYLTCH